jgi:DNA-directed RNA polymerase subunit omega
MARISSEKAAQQVGNRYDLVLIAAARARELNRGAKPKLNTKHGNSLTALTEIEEGLVGREYLKRISDTKQSKRKYRMNPDD